MTYNRAKFNQNLMFIILGIFLLSWSNISNATIQIKIHPKTITLDKTFHITITIAGAQSNKAPDLTPLEESFNIIGTEHSMSYSLINGQATSVTQWIILLTAKKSGTLIIPPLTIGAQKTPEAQINIEPTATISNTQTINDTRLVTNTNIKNPTINEEVIYTVKLLNNQHLLDANYQPPTVDDALIISLDSNNNQQQTINEQNYQVSEQKYAIFPQKSGPLTIHGPSFNALAYDHLPRPIHLQGKTILLNVKPIPTQKSNQFWLPAKQLELKDKFDAPLNSPQPEGRILTRTITLEAHSLPAELLPNLTFSSTDQFNVYAEAAVLNNQVKEQALIGTSKINITYILNHTGNISIPELTIPWYNTQTKTTEIAKLPAHHLKVFAKATTKPDKPINNYFHTKKAAKSNQIHTPFTINASWSITGLFAIIWLLTIGIWWYTPLSFSRRRNRRQALKCLQKACQQNSPRQAHQALIAWATLQWPNLYVLNLNDLTKLSPDPELKKQLQLLSQTLYSQQYSSSWKGKDLWKCVCALKRSNKSNF